MNGITKRGGSTEPVPVVRPQKQDCVGVIEGAS